MSRLARKSDSTGRTEGARELFGKDEREKIAENENKLIYNWVLANPVLFENPILNVKGQLTFWEYDENAPGPEPKKRCGLCKHFRRPETTCPTFCALRMDALAKAKIKNRKTAKVGEKTEVCNQFEY